jgi:hypothetical protein
MDQEEAMQPHPELVTAALAGEHERDLARRADRRRMLPARERQVRGPRTAASGARTLSALMRRALPGGDTPR